MKALTAEEVEDWAGSYETPILQSMGPKARLKQESERPRAAFIRSAAAGKPERHGLTDEHLKDWIKDLEDLSDWHHGKTRFGHAEMCDQMVTFLKTAMEKL